MIAAHVVTTVDLADLRRLRAGVRPRLARAVATEAHDLQANAQMRAPVRRHHKTGQRTAGGTLRRSIRARRISDLTWVVEATVDYAAFVEYGTGIAGAASAHPTLPDEYKHGPSAGMAAQPYMTPAAELSKRRFPQRIEEALRGA